MAPNNTGTRTKILLGAAGAVVVLLGAYLIFFNNKPTSAVVTTGAPSSSAEITFLDLSSKIEPIQFDTTIFTDARFLALVDIHTAITPEVPHRSDPFAPIPGVSTTK